MVEEAEHKAAPPRPVPALAARRQTFLSLLMGAVILLSGMAIGVGGAMLLGSRESDSNGTEQTAAAVTARVDEICDLDDQQAEKVKQAVGKRLEALQDIREEMAEEVLMQHRVLREEMARILSPEQLGLWTRHMDDLRRRSAFLRRARRGGRGGWPMEGRRPPRPGEEGGWQGRGKPLGPRNPVRIFRMLDADGDDALSKDETPPRLWTTLLRADADADEVVTFEELRATFGREHDEGPPPPPAPEPPEGPPPAP